MDGGDTCEVEICAQAGDVVFNNSPKSVEMECTHSVQLLRLEIRNVSCQFYEIQVFQKIKGVTTKFLTVRR